MCVVANRFTTTESGYRVGLGIFREDNKLGGEKPEETQGQLFFELHGECGKKIHRCSVCQPGSVSKETQMNGVPAILLLMLRHKLLLLKQLQHSTSGQDLRDYSDHLNDAQSLFPFNPLTSRRGAVGV